MTIKRVLLGGQPGFVATAETFFSNKEKFSVMIAENVEALLNMLEKKPDLAVVDIDLPKRGGDECCKKAKDAGLSPGTLFVLAVSPENHRDIGRCLDAGCDAILPKPLRHERLAGVVTRLLFMGRHIPSRFPVRLPVRCGIQPHKLTDNYSANLTTKGVFLETEKVVPTGTPLHVAFTLPHGGTTIECTARVAWLNDQILRSEPLLPCGMGLEFVDIDDRQVNAIREFLYQLAGT